jgi:protein-S-isoprenylcysteine O-methyltransferase Ste14
LEPDLDFTFFIPAISVFWLGSEIVLARMKHSGQSSTSHDKFSLRVLWTVIMISVFTGVFLGRSRFGSILESASIMLLLGIVLIVAGLAVRWSAILTLQKYFTVDVAIRKDHKVVTTGLYRYVRHPAYLGSLLSFLGLAISFSNWLAAVVMFVPILSAFIYRIRVEEEALDSFLGDAYRQYCSSTKRLIPGMF